MEGFLRRQKAYQMFTLEIGNEQKLEMLLVQQVQGSATATIGRHRSP